MAVYLVTWDLNREKPNYTQARTTFITELQKFDYVKDPGLDSVWFVGTTWSAQQVSDFLRKALDDNDRLFVTQLNRMDSCTIGFLQKHRGRED